MSDAKPTPDQLRAKDAWAVVEKVKGTKGGKDFGGAARKLPVRIMASGLGQSLAFLKAKDKTPLLLKALGEWVLQGRPDLKDKDLLNAVINGNADELRIYTQETMAYLVWLNRFCEANDLFDDVDSNNGN